MTAPRALDRVDTAGAVPLELTVNGTPVATEVPARMTLADLLRERLGLTGTHLGCEHGVCGMCTVLVDGQSVRSCILFACQADGAEVVTVEGLGTPDDLHPLQEAFGRHHGLQCGFCTPGFLMSSYDLISHDRTVAREDLPAELSGVLCGCTGYRNIIDAVEDVATNGEEFPKPKNRAATTLLGRSSHHSPQPGKVHEPVTRGNAQPHPEQIGLPKGDPTVDIQISNDVSASPSEVAAVFDDLHLLIRCLPGASLNEDLGGGWYSGSTRVALGPIRLNFQGFAQVTTHEPNRLHVLAQGRDTGSGGAQADIELQAIPQAEQTRIETHARIYLTGRLAGFGRALAGDVSRRIFEDFAANVDNAAQGADPSATTKPRGLLRLLWDSLRSRLTPGRGSNRSGGRFTEKR